MQGQRLHLSIYHTDWPAKCTSALLLPPPLSLAYLSSSLSVFHSLHTHSIPACSSSASPIHPSIHLSSVSNHLSPPFPSVPLSSSSLFVCLSVPSSPPAAFRARTQLNYPEGPSFKHRNQKHMAHFQLPRSITAIYPEIAAKFPKVSSRFTTDCSVCVCHILNQASFLLLLSLSLCSPRLSHQIFQMLSSGF